MVLITSTNRIHIGRSKPFSSGQVIENWTPSDMPSNEMKVGLDITDEFAVTLNAGSVSNVLDMTGNGNDGFEAVGSNQGVYKDGSAGYKCLDLSDPESAGLRVPNLGLTTGATVIVVWKSVLSDNFIMLGTDTTEVYLGLGSENNTSLSIDRDCGDPVYWKNGGMNNIVSRGDIYDSYGSDELSIFEAREVDMSSWTGDLRLGFGPFSTSFDLQGELYEFYVLTPEVTDENRVRLSGYLAHKYALQAKLPLGHPYKTNPPTTAPLTKFTPFIIGMELVLNPQIADSVQLNGVNVSGMENTSSKEYGKFIQDNSVQQALYNLNDANANGLRTLDTKGKNKGGVETTDDVQYADAYFAVNYKNGTESTFENYNTLLRNNDDTSQRLMGDDGDDVWYSINTMNGAAEINGRAESTKALPMPFGSLRMQGEITDKGVVTVLFNESSGVRAWEGSMAYMALSKTVLSRENADKTIAYIHHECGIQSDLPLGNPYRTTRPTLNDPTWTPWQLEPLLWLTATSDAITLNGSDASQVDDRARNSNNMEQSTAADQPGYDSTNNKLIFTGTESLTSGDVDTFKSLHETGGTLGFRFNLADVNTDALMALFTTQRPTSGDKGVFIAIDDRGTNENAVYVIVGRGISGSANVAYGVIDGSSSLPISDTGDHTLIVTFDATNMKIYFDGVLEYTIALKNAFATGPSSEIGALGADANGDWGLEGGIGKVTISNDKLDDAGALQLHNYLNS